MSIRRALFFFLMLLSAACDGRAQSRFYQFCEKNIPPLPEQKVLAKGVEFRGDFNLLFVHSWGDYAEYVEFSGEHIGKQYPSRSEFRVPSLLGDVRYRMSLYEDWAPPCRQYQILREAPRELREEYFSKYRADMEKNPAFKCQGIVVIDAFEAEFIVERIDETDFHEIMGRRVSATIFRVTSRDSSAVIGELHVYAMSSREEYQDLLEFPQGYSCSSVEGEGRISTADLSLIFDSIE